MAPESSEKVDGKEKQASKPNEKKRKFAGITTVTLVVGPSETEFIVHEEILCEVSPYFAAAFQSSFKEAADKKIIWKDEKVDTVDSFFQWLYNTPAEDVKLAEDNDRIKRDGDLLELYYLAERYQIIRLKNHIIDRFVQIMDEDNKITIALPQMATLYANTTPSCKLRKLIITYWVSKIRNEWFEKEFVTKFLTNNPEIMLDLLLVYTTLIAAEGVTLPKSEKLNGKDYYEDS